MLPNRLPVELLRALERRGAPAYRVESAGPDGVCLVAAGYPSIHLFARGDNLVARCAGVEHSAPLWSLDHLAAVLMPSLAAPLPDIGGNLRKVLRKVKRRLKPPAPSVPLTPAQQADAEKVKPLVIGMIKRGFPDVQDKKGLIDESMPLICEAVQAFDGRGSLSGFVCQRVRQRLCSWIGEQAKQIPQYPTDMRPVRGDEDALMPGVGREPAYTERPSRRLEVEEAAAAARRYLSAGEIEILRLALQGKTPREIASLLRMSVATVYRHRTDARNLIRRLARESKLSWKEVVETIFESA
jgi:DNA-binding CsgD family transcriptional regulator